MSPLLANILGLTSLCVQLWFFGLRPLKELPAYLAIAVILGAALTGF